ncbi:MAG: hypothetical protein OHK0013_30340 [Sandaracinaceae bacterium]
MQAEQDPSGVIVHLRRPTAQSERTWAPLVVAGVALALGGCGASATTDAGPRHDARPSLVEDPSPPLPTPTGALRVRLANFVVAGPSLTICLSTIPGTGVAETEGHILGSPDPARGLDGTLPYPGISPYIPLPTYAADGFAYVVRLYDRASVPFALGGVCPQPGAVTPLVEATLPTATTPPRATLVAAGVPPGAPVACAGGCPAPRAFVIADDPTPPTAGARARVVHTVPNLPAPIHVCFDPDYVIGAPGAMAPIRVLPEASDTNGLSFGEATAFVDVPPLSGGPGAFFVHATVPGVPDCAPPTTALGPITVPFPVPDTAPAEVARVIDAGDVISFFAFGRAGRPCMEDAECAGVPGARCSARGVCTDALDPSILPWQDVMGM